MPWCRCCRKWRPLDNMYHNSNTRHYTNFSMFRQAVNPHHHTSVCNLQTSVDKICRHTSLHNPVARCFRRPGPRYTDARFIVPAGSSDACVRCSPLQSSTAQSRTRTSRHVVPQRREPCSRGDCGMATVASRVHGEVDGVITEAKSSYVGHSSVHPPIESLRESQSQAEVQIQKLPVDLEIPTRRPEIDAVVPDSVGRRGGGKTRSKAQTKHSGKRNPGLNVEKASHTEIHNAKYWEDKVTAHIKQKERTTELYGVKNMDRISALKAKVDQRFEAHVKQFKIVEWPVVPITSSK